MTKLYSIILSLFLTLNMSGCTPPADIELEQPSQVVAESTTQTTNEDIKDEKKTDDSSPDLSGEQMRVHFIDVGQADSVFIELSNGQTMLIDAGRSSNATTIINYIKDLKYGSIDFVVATHPHDDHIGGMADVLNNFDIGTMYMPKQAHTIKAFTNMLDVIENKNIVLHTAKAGTNILSSGNINIDVLAPFSESESNLNNVSAVVKITYGKTVMLFTGDAEHVIENQLLNSNIDADVLKVGHHGASSSSSPNFIKAVSPEIAVISVGAGNNYKHPHAEALAILKQVGAEIYRTDEQGTIIVTADSNKKITVNKKASTIKENAPPANNSENLEQAQESNVSNNDNQRQIVYRTKTGKKYHRSGCTYLKSIIETTVGEAQAMGLEPCSGGNPPR